MAEAALSFAETARPSGRFLSIRIGWRNLWRNRRRTWLTAGGIAFAILLVVLTMSFQLGMYDVMEENATSLMAGHAQVQSAAYVDDNRFDGPTQGRHGRRTPECAPTYQCPENCPNDRI